MFVGRVVGGGGELGVTEHNGQKISHNEARNEEDILYIAAELLFYIQCGVCMKWSS